MIAIGEQYPKDNKLDNSGFLAAARLHQSTFRSKELKVECDGYGNYLTVADATNGMNFHNDLNVFSEVKKRYPNYSKGVYANMLRSEHIGFNFFSPMKEDLDFCKNIFSEILEDKIELIDRIEVEYAPSPASKYLNDKTSFDTYVEYTTTDNIKGIIGIEVKYSERGYDLKKKSKEESYIKNENSRYYQISKRSKLYIDGSIQKLVSDDYRQIWRNHLLGESILMEDSKKYKRFTSLILFPESNSHFINASANYMDMLKQNDKSFISLTYEQFLLFGKKHSPNAKFKNWLNYLERRYII